MNPIGQSVTEVLISESYWSVIELLISESYWSVTELEISESYWSITELLQCSVNDTDVLNV